MAEFLSMTIVLMMIFTGAISKHGHGDNPGERTPMENLNCRRPTDGTTPTPEKVEEHLCCYLNFTTVPCIVERTCEPEHDYDNEDDDYDYNEDGGSDGSRRKRSWSWSWSWSWSRSWSRSWSWRNMCRRIGLENCTLSFCTPTCCDNWRRDYTGRCVVPVSDTIEDIICENGGSTMGDSCLCADGFQGRFCEIPICKGGCGAGQCKVQDERPKCICPRDFSGTNCQQFVCLESCKHGQCFPDGLVARCLCDPGYQGTRCDIAMYKPGMCPKATIGICSESCTGDNDCPGIEKCCKTCGHNCMIPSNGTCITDNGLTIEVDVEFTPEPCKICTCIRAGTIECRKMICPIHENCISIKPGRCCPVCENVAASRPRNYHGPQILNCPNTIQSIMVEETSDIATVPGLKAIDFQGNPVGVNLSQDKFKSCACKEKDGNLHRVTATTERDQFGNFTSCHFTINVQDPHSPKFRTCPATITAWTYEKITWDEPEVEDNVGIAKKYIQTPHRKGSQFEIGQHTVVLIVEDYDGNRDTCSFIVAIFNTNTEYSKLPADLKRREPEVMPKEAMISGFIAGGVALILLLAVIVTCCICIRRRKMQAAARSQATPDSVKNRLYSIYGNLPPYSSPTKTGSVITTSPNYEVVSSTPTKTELEALYRTMEQNTPPQQNGVYDNPIYSTTDEVKTE